MADPVAGRDEQHSRGRVASDDHRVVAGAGDHAQRLVLMDEPTAALGVAETARVEELILRLRERGRAILLVSHSLDQVLRLADRVCVLRHGRQVGVRRTCETSGDELVAMITGLR